MLVWVGLGWGMGFWVGLGWVDLVWAGLGGFGWVGLGWGGWVDGFVGRLVGWLVLYAEPTTKNYIRAEGDFHKEICS